MEEAKVIAEAINSLAGGFFKDYIYPIATAVLSTLLAALVAFWTVRHQETLQNEKNKLEIANLWILKFEEARTNLFAIKRNYHGELTESPFERLVLIASNPLPPNLLEQDYTNLTFIIPNGKETQRRPYRWSQITRIRAILSNYNELMRIWERRHALHEQFKEHLQHRFPNHMSTGIDLNMAVETYGQARMNRLIDTNEQAILLTDQLLHELTDFVLNFPSYVKTKINLKRIARFGTLLYYYGDTTDELRWLLNSSPKADYSSVETLFNETQEEILRRYRNLM